MREGIRAELRSILRQYAELNKPLDRFEFAAGRSVAEPRYYVAFDTRDRRGVRGLRSRIGTIQLPDEGIRDSTLQFAQSVWHLKDRLHQWLKARDMLIDIDSFCQHNIHILICADLANTKKHGTCTNRSGLKPRLGLVKFDVSKNGIVELFYDGAMKEKELLVSDPVPIPCEVQLEVEGREDISRNAVTVVWRAFLDWLPLIKQAGVLASDDPESVSLRELLFETGTV